MKKLTTRLVMAAVAGLFLVVGCGKKNTQAQVKADANAAVASAQKDADKKAEEAKKAAAGLLGTGASSYARLRRARVRPPEAGRLVRQ